MNIRNRVELKLENFEKCHLICDQDCPLGVVYDYATALMSFVVDEMKKRTPEKKEACNGEQS